jgi:hypothetical protein
MVAKKGSDGNIYFPVQNVKTGKNEYINAIKMSQSVVAFPESRKILTQAPLDSVSGLTPGATQYLKFK